MREYENLPTYNGGRYRHTKTNFLGVVVKEIIPNPWSPDRVFLTLEHAGNKREFQLTELEEIDEP
jgi:hypothetical protein